MNDVKPSGMIGVLGEIRAERHRQIAKGYDADHDDSNESGCLAVLAAGVCLGPDSDLTADNDLMEDQIVHIVQKHPRRQQLIIAAALVVAEIERLDRKQGGRSS